MKCKFCGKENKKEARFCSNCAMPIEYCRVSDNTEEDKLKVCELCKERVNRKAKFCTRCGHVFKKEVQKKKAINFDISLRSLINILFLLFLILFVLYVAYVVYIFLQSALIDFEDLLNLVE